MFMAALLLEGSLAPMKAPGLPFDENNML